MATTQQSTQEAHSIPEVCDRLFFDLVKADAYRKVYAGMTAHLTVETIRRIAPTYFALTQTALLEMSCVIVVRLYDSSRGTATLKYLIELAERKAGEFASGRAEALNRIEEARQCLAEAGGALAPVKELRDTLLAHRNKSSLHSEPLDELPAIDAEIGSLIDAGCRAINAIRLAFDGVGTSPELLDITDYEGMIRVLREGKKAQIRAVEDSQEGRPWDEPLAIKMKKDLDIP